MTTERPIFVVGFQRSGTTLIQALLGAHPRIASPPETHFIFRIASLRDYYGDLADDGNLRRVLHDTVHPPVPLFDDCGFDTDALFDRARSGPRTYAAALDTVMADFARRQQKDRWCEKTPGQLAAEVFDLCPSAQVVHIVRDPRDVVASSLETPWTRGDAAAVARHWRQFTLSNVRGGRVRGPGSMLQIHYEDLTSDPEPVLRVVCAFLGEDYVPEMLSDPGRRRPTVAAAVAPWQGRALEPVSPNSQGTWRSRLGRLDRIRVAGIVADMLGPLGYEPARPRSVALGRVVNFSLGLRPKRKPRRGRGRLSSQERYERIQRYMAEQEHSISSASS